MVTTTGTASQEAIDLFRRAMKKVVEAIDQCDGFEQEVHDLTRDAFIVGVEGLKPALKLVDKPLDSWMGYERGIEIRGSEGHSIFLLRKGVYYARWLSDTHLSAGVNSGKDLFRDIVYFITKRTGDPEEVLTRVIEEVLKLIQGLQEILVDALKKNEARHEKLSSLLAGLGQIGSPKA